MTSLNLNYQNYKEKCPQKRVENFQVGDLLFDRYKASKSGFFYSLITGGIIDYVICKLQQLSQSLFQKHHNLAPEDAKTEHVYQVVEVNRDNGQVLVADAVPGSKKVLRIIDLFQDHSVPGKNYEIEVFRLKDTNLAKKSAQMAKHLAEKSSYLLTEQEKENKELKKVKSTFSFFRGIQSMLYSYDDKYSYQEKKRIFTKIFDSILQSKISTEEKTPKSFFCSFFISDQILGACSLQAFENLYNKLGEAEKQEINELIGQVLDDTENLDYRNSKGRVSALADILTKKYGDRIIKELEKLDATPKISIKQPATKKTIKRIINPRYTSPQMLKHIVKANGAEMIAKIDFTGAE